MAALTPSDSVHIESQVFGETTESTLCQRVKRNRLISLNYF
jgi:hypothetical protein